MPACRLLPCVFFALLAATTAARADPVGEPAEATITEGGQNRGRYPFGISLETDHTHTNGGQSGTSTQVSLGNLASGTLGFAATQGHATGPDRQWHPPVTVDASGTVWFALSVTPLPGGLVLPAYPVKVRAAGEASVQTSGAAAGRASAVMSFTDLSLIAQSPAGTGERERFAHVATQWLSPGLHRGWVQAAGWGMALCQKLDVNDPEDSCIRGSVAYTAVVDPMFSLDQAAWDASHPGQPLVLDSHYRIDVNPNIPAGPQPLVPIGVVPEPATAALLLAGLVATAAAARQRRWR